MYPAPTRGYFEKDSKGRVHDRNRRGVPHTFVRLGSDPLAPFRSFFTCIPVRRYTIRYYIDLSFFFKSSGPFDTATIVTTRVTFGIGAR